MGNRRTDLVLIRHGETSWSTSRRHTGRTDIPLTDRGRRQARALAEALDGYRFARAFASPLSRAWETARLAGLHPSADDDLLEWDYGRYEGITTAEIRTTIADWSVWTHPIFGGESVAEVGARVDRVIERSLDMDGPIVLVAHAHVLRILGARWLQFDAHEGRRFSLDTASVSVLGWERENRVLLRWNSPHDAQLPGDLG